MKTQDHEIRQEIQDGIDRSRQVNLLTNPNFKFIIEELPNVALFSQSFQLPGVRTSPATVATPFVDMKYHGDKVSFDDLHINFLVDENLENYYEIWAWMMHVTFPRSFEQYGAMMKRKTRYPWGPNRARSDISVVFLTNKTNAFEIVKFVSATPIAIDSISMSHNSNGINHPTCSVTFSYDYFVLVEKDRTEPSKVAFKDHINEQRKALAAKIEEAKANDSKAKRKSKSGSSD